MQTISIQPSSAAANTDRFPRRSYVQGVIERAGNLLPAQGPITAFVFLNTLQALEDLPFEEAVAKGARLFGCQPWLREDRYREKLAAGRIRKDDLAAVLRENLTDRADVRIGSLGSRLDLLLPMLSYSIRTGPAHQFPWSLSQTEAF